MNIKEVLLGTAIGDAYGAGIEFQDRNWIRKHVDFSKFVNARSEISVQENKIETFTKNYKEWDYTDDTEMTIGLIKAMMSKQEFSENLLVDKWREEYNLGIEQKGYGRNGHGSMRWYYSGEKTISEIRDFQRNRRNPGNAPAMRSVPLGLLHETKINRYAEINAKATHPNINAIISSQCIAWAAEYMMVKKGDKKKIIEYCVSKVELNQEYKDYFKAVNQLGHYDKLTENDFSILCGSQPIEKPYFLDGINGVPSDSKYTAGCVLYVLKECNDAVDALRKSIYLGGDVDSIASITTGIMGGYSGLDSIPEYMKTNVEGLDYLTDLSIQLEEFLKN